MESNNSEEDIISGAREQLNFHKIHQNQDDKSEKDIMSSPFIPDIDQIEIERQFCQESFFMAINAQNFQKIKNLTQQAELCHLKCRFTVWRIFLGIINPLSDDQDEQLLRKQVNGQRKHYYELKEKLSKQQHQIEENKNQQNVVINPLMKIKNSKQNIWDNFFQDSELKNQIKLDIDRTYQDKEFFKHPFIKSLLSSVLFVWCKENSDISYRQGMNELIAIITYVCFTEQQINVSEEEEKINLFKFLNNSRHSEADIYTIFDILLRQIGHADMFRSQEDSKSKLNTTKQQNFVVARSKKIFYTYVAAIDNELHRHLKMLEIQPQIFLMYQYQTLIQVLYRRWIRCLLTREFHMQDSIKFWDNIFLNYYEDRINNNFKFLDCACLAMIIWLKQQCKILTILRLYIYNIVLQRDDQIQCVQRLLKFPPVESVLPLIQKSWEFIQIYDQLEQIAEQQLHQSPITSDRREHNQIEQAKLEQKQLQDKNPLIEDLNIKQNKKPGPILFNSGLGINNLNNIKQSLFEPKILYFKDMNQKVQAQKDQINEQQNKQQIKEKIQFVEQFKQAQNNNQDDLLEQVNNCLNDIRNRIQTFEDQLMNQFQNNGHEEQYGWVQQEFQNLKEIISNQKIKK